MKVSSIATDSEVDLHVGHKDDVLIENTIAIKGDESGTCEVNCEKANAAHKCQNGVNQNKNDTSANIDHAACKYENEMSSARVNRVVEMQCNSFHNEQNSKDDHMKTLGECSDDEIHSPNDYVKMQNVSENVDVI